MQDDTSFYLQDIPVLHFFTGQHENYHKPSDDSDLINYDGLDLISNYIFSIISDLDDNGKLKFRKTKNESEESPRFKVSLGIQRISSYIDFSTSMVERFHRLDKVTDFVFFPL